MLLSRPTPVLHFDLSTRPLPLEGSSTTTISLCPPFHISQLQQEPLQQQQQQQQQQREQEQGQEQKQQQEQEQQQQQQQQGPALTCTHDSVAAAASAPGEEPCEFRPPSPAPAPAPRVHLGRLDCIVYWFEADCGAGGWLSTRPGSSCTRLGHWEQSVQFLKEPLDLDLDLDLDLGLGVGPPAGGGSCAAQGGVEQAPPAPAAPRLSLQLHASYMLDRVKLSVGQLLQAPRE